MISKKWRHTENFAFVDTFFETRVETALPDDKVRKRSEIVAKSRKIPKKCTLRLFRKFLVALKVETEMMQTSRCEIASKEPFWRFLLNSCLCRSLTSGNAEYSRERLFNQFFDLKKNKNCYPCIAYFHPIFRIKKSS